MKLPQSKLRELELTDRGYRPGLVRHVVLFRYRTNVAEADVHEIEHRFHQLVESTRDNEPYIVSIESGIQNSPEGLGQGFSHAFIVTFASQGDRNYYIGEPFIREPDLFDTMHQSFKEFVGPYLESRDGSALVFDFAPESSSDLG